MQSTLPADLYNKVKDKYEGTQFRVEHPINIYFFWMNMSRPPFDDLKVRQAVNYAVDTEALERIYAGSLTAAHQILPEGMPGHEEFDLYPHDMAKAEALIKRPTRATETSRSGPTTKAPTTKRAPTTRTCSKNSASTSS